MAELLACAGCLVKVSRQVPLRLLSLPLRLPLPMECTLSPIQQPSRSAAHTFLHSASIHVWNWVSCVPCEPPGLKPASIHAPVVRPRASPRPLSTPCMTPASTRRADRHAAALARAGATSSASAHPGRPGMASSKLIAVWPQVLLPGWQSHILLCPKTRPKKRLHLSSQPG